MSSEPAKGQTPEELQQIYGHRFDDAELAAKARLWQTLCEAYFQQFVPATGTVLDLGSGSCEFVNAIQARTKIAVDLNPDTARFADPEVDVLTTASTDLSGVKGGSVDTVFTSNFFEHLASSTELLATLAECRRVLAPQGRIVVLMPNIRNLGGAYWDYLDHSLALTHVSLTEALELSGFAVEKVIPKFLPYTVKNQKLPPNPTLVRAYLRLPVVWRLLGKQMLVIARPAA